MNATTLPRYLRIDTMLGGMILAVSDAGLCGAWFDGQKHWPEMRDWRESRNDVVLREAAKQLGAYFSGELQAFDLPLDDSRGTPFQREVWAALREVRFGRTTSYGAIARTIGKAAAVRAVGAAVGRNPLSVIVPCHRVLGADGSLTGYAGGVERKRALLQLEGVL